MASRTSSKVVFNFLFLLSLILLITYLAPEVDARKLQEAENGKPVRSDAKVNAKKGLGEMKNLPPFPNIPGIPFPQFPPPFDIPNVPPLPDFPLPPFPFPPFPFFQPPPA